MRKILVTLVAALATLVPSAGHAAPRPLPTLTYTTTADYAGYLQTTATVSNLRFEQNPVLPGTICVGYDVFVHGSFEYWTGAYFTTMRQLAPQHQQECSGLPRDSLQAALDCPAGTFEVGLFVRYPTVIFTGDDGSTYHGTAQLGSYTLAATTVEQREAICDLEARLHRYGDKKLVAELNELLALFA